MEAFRLRDGVLHAEGLSLEAIARQHRTPCYVYSRAAFEARWREFDVAFASHDHLICYAVKANSNLGVLDALARLGSGFDIVSGGELGRVLAAGGEARRVVFAGVGKTREEMAQALRAGIASFNVESAQELECLNGVAASVGIPAPVSVRVNPDVDPQTHPYIATGLNENKFGVPIEEAPGIYRRAIGLKHLRVTGVDCHIGSQLVNLAPFTAALERVLGLVDGLHAAGISIDHLNLGGGMGIRYLNEEPPTPRAYAEALLERVSGRQLKIIVEPGRAIAGESGVLITKVLYIKRNRERQFAVVDAAMNDLLRPALYQAWQAIEPVRQRDGDARADCYDIVGPICESADFLGKGRRLALEAGDLLAVRCAGAYGFVMSSNYNARPRAAEVLVDGDTCHLVRRRETLDDLLAPESRLPPDPPDRA